jgi:hypothetical protein
MTARPWPAALSRSCPVGVRGGQPSDSGPRDSPPTVLRPRASGPAGAPKGDDDRHHPDRDLPDRSDRSAAGEQVRASGDVRRRNPIPGADYRNPGALPDGPVLVVGAGNSGLRIARELAATRPVHLSVGELPVMLPQRLLGGDLFSDRTDPAVGLVIWATGYRSDFSWIDLPGHSSRQRGPPPSRRHRRTGPVLSGPALAAPWQHTRGSALLSFVYADVTYRADRIDAKSALRCASHPVAAR